VKFLNSASSIHFQEEFLKFNYVSMARGRGRQPVRFDPIAPEALLGADADDRTRRETAALL
jgi:hypothetical protein